MFYRRTEYNFISNLSDTFSSTGVYSDPFKALFLHFSDQVKHEIDLKM